MSPRDPDRTRGPASGKAGSESDGAAYPNPHTGKAGTRNPKHGGQSEQAYHGPGQLGDQSTGGTPNAVTRNNG